MKLKEEMYVRFKDNKYIAKIVNVNDFREPTAKYGLEANWYNDIIFIGEDDIQKASYNIIDLIEEGDYVNGYLVYEINKNCVLVGYKCFKTQFDNEEDFLYQKIYENDIKSIVTKEQFDSMKYEISN